MIFWFLLLGILPLYYLQNYILYYRNKIFNSSIIFYGFKQFLRSKEIIGHSCIHRNHIEFIVKESLKRYLIHSLLFFHHYQNFSTYQYYLVHWYLIHLSIELYQSICDKYNLSLIKMNSCLIYKWGELLSSLLLHNLRDLMNHSIEEIKMLWEHKIQFVFLSFRWNYFWKGDKSNYEWRRLSKW